MPYLGHVVPRPVPGLSWPAHQRQQCVDLCLAWRAQSLSAQGIIHCIARYGYGPPGHGAGGVGGTVDGVVATAGATLGASTVGTSFRGRFRSSRVTPSSFVIPTTAGSPFLMNSYWPGSLLPASRKASRATCSCNAPLISKMTRLTATLAAQWSKEPFPLPIRTCSFVSCLVLDARRNRRGQTDLVAADVDANVTIDSCVQPVSLPTKSLLDGRLRELQLCRAYPPVVIDHAQPVVSNHNRCAFNRAPCRHSRSSLHLLLRSVDEWLQP